jgi:hypothetical protein
MNALTNLTLVFFPYHCTMKKSIFKILAKFNKLALPKYYTRDLTKLKKWEKAIVGYKYWITTNALD